MTTSFALVAVALRLAGAAIDDAPTPADPAPPSAAVEPAPIAAPPVDAPPVVDAAPPSALDVAEQRLEAGAAIEAVAMLLREQRVALDRGSSAAERGRMSNLLGRAADVLADGGDIKAAAVAADASWQIDGRPVRPRVALLLTHYAERLRDSDPAAARAIAERALVVDPDNAAARALASSLAGSESWVNGHLTLGGGVGLAVVSSAAFVYGFDVERETRGSIHPAAEVDTLLFRRGIAAGVAWPSAVAAVIATGVGLALIMAHDPGPEPALPSPFAPLPPNDTAVLGGGR
ncbi:MAG: hypothetical protein Q8O67_24765 [Deltaproteobacteria bacterium]|nr:hypothetical protein [Deltaproteobacteria bacterium]